MGAKTLSIDRNIVARRFAGVNEGWGHCSCADTAAGGKFKLDIQMEEYDILSRNVRSSL